MKKIFALLFAFSAVTFSSCLDDSSNNDSYTFYMSHLEDLTDYVKEKTFWNGETGTGMIQDDFFVYTNNYNAEYGSWDGFALSRSTSVAFSAENLLTDQYNCCTINPNSQVFLVGYYSAWANNAPTIYTTVSKTDMTRRPFYPLQVNVTNAAYTVSSMKYGDAYAKKFEASDYLYLFITGYRDGKETNSLKCPLAENGKIVEQWCVADLQSLGLVDEIRFTMDSSDKGEWGINTPTYFCLDNLTITFPKDNEKK